MTLDNKQSVPLEKSDQETSTSIFHILGKKEERVLGLFRYGSFVYETNLDDSDKDFIVILPFVKNPHNIIEREVDGQKYSFVPHTETSFQRGLWAHEPYAIEIFYLPKEHVIKPYVKTWDFSGVDKKILRHSFSQKASHSYVKAKKKLDVEKDIKRGKKSLFHSLRILAFGIQLANHGKICNYKEANDWWWDIWTSPEVTWEGLEKKYRPIYNKLCTDFREVCQNEFSSSNELSV